MCVFVSQKTTAQPLRDNDRLGNVASSSGGGVELVGGGVLAEDANLLVDNSGHTGALRGGEAIHGLHSLAAAKEDVVAGPRGTAGVAAKVVEVDLVTVLIAKAEHGEAGALADAHGSGGGIIDGVVIVGGQAPGLAAIAAVSAVHPEGGAGEDGSVGVHIKVSVAGHILEAAAEGEGHGAVQALEAIVVHLGRVDELTGVVLGVALGVGQIGGLDVANGDGHDRELLAGGGGTLVVDGSDGGHLDL